MKKILLLFMMCALLPKTAGAQGTPTDDTFTVSDLAYDEDITWYEGAVEKEGAYYFIVSISGERLYCACNLSITLPTGLSFIYDDDEGEYLIRKNNDSEKLLRNSHAIGSGKPGTAMNIAVSSNTNQEFRATSGKLFNVYVNIDASAFTSSFSPKPIVKLSGLNLTTSAAEKYVPADFACRPFTTGIPTSRTLTVNVSAANKIGTLILPFDAALPSGLKAYTCNAIDEDLLTLMPAASIEACKPYIVYAENGYSNDELTGTAKLTDASNVDDVFTDGYLTGVLTGTTVNTGYILQNQGDGPMFYDAEGVTFSLPAGRCYLTPPASPIKSFAFNFGDTDGVEKTFNSPFSIFNFFDLQGRPVSFPSRGIYIQGTRKMVVK